MGSTSTPEQIIAETDEFVENNGMVSNLNESEVILDASNDEYQVVFVIFAGEEQVINNNETMVNILAELKTIHDQRIKCYENTFITKKMEKTSVDLKDRPLKRNAAKLLVESLRDLINNMNVALAEVSLSALQISTNNQKLYSI